MSAPTDSAALPERQVLDDEATRIYELMATARELEVQLARTYAEGKLPGWIHSCEGHEAFGAAVALTLGDTDHLVPHYRSRPEQLGKGMSLREVVAEVFATTDAASRGRGGETHVSSATRRIYGMTGVLGANIPLATGVAYASKMRGLDEVTVCSFGDGTANRGAFHEALNMAAIWDLPVVFVCENNTYAELSRTSDFIRVDSIAERAAAYGMPGWLVDGHDPDLVVGALEHAVRLARAGRPSLLEVRTVRRRGHWEGDQQAYRAKQELSGLDATDAVVLYRRRLLEQRGVAEAVVAAIEASAREQVTEALAWAEAGPRPTAGEVLGGVYQEQDDD